MSLISEEMKKKSFVTVNLSNLIHEKSELRNNKKKNKKNNGFKTLSIVVSIGNWSEIKRKKKCKYCENREKSEQNIRKSCSILKFDEETNKVK